MPHAWCLAFNDVKCICACKKLRRTRKYDKRAAPQGCRTVNLFRKEAAEGHEILGHAAAQDAGASGAPCLVTGDEGTRQLAQAYFGSCHTHFYHTASSGMSHVQLMSHVGLQRCPGLGVRKHMACLHGYHFSDTCARQHLHRLLPP